MTLVLVSVASADGVPPLSSLSSVSSVSSILSDYCKTLKLKVLKSLLYVLSPGEVLKRGRSGCCGGIPLVGTFWTSRILRTFRMIRTIRTIRMKPHIERCRGTICQHYRHRAVVRPAVLRGNLRDSAIVRRISASAGGRSIANGAIRRNAATMPTGGDSVSGSWRNIRCARTAASMAERRSRSRSTTSGKLRTLLTSGWSRTPVCRSVSAVTVCGRAGASSPGMGSRHEARPRKTARAAARKSNGQTV